VVAREADATSSGGEVSGTDFEADRPALRTWRRLAHPGAEFIGLYDSLREMTRYAQHVVYAHGRVFGEGEASEDTLKSVAFGLRVEDVIRSDGFTVGDSLPLELGPIPAQIDVSAEYAHVVGDEGIFMVNLKGTAQPEFGVTGSAKEEQSLGFFKPVTHQGVFLNDRGEVAVALFVDPRTFP
jgi:hypothetical protein